MPEYEAPEGFETSYDPGSEPGGENVLETPAPADAISGVDPSALGVDGEATWVESEQDDPAAGMVHEPRSNEELAMSVVDEDEAASLSAGEDEGLLTGDAAVLDSTVAVDDLAEAAGEPDPLIDRDAEALVAEADQITGLAQEAEIDATVDEAEVDAGEELDPVEEMRSLLAAQPGEWYVVQSYANYENRVKSNLEQRRVLAEHGGLRLPDRGADRGRAGPQERQAADGRAEEVPGLRLHPDGPDRRVLVGRCATPRT